MRKDRGYVDFLETLARYHAADASASGDLDRAILDFPYVNYRYGDTLAVIASLWAASTVVVLSDGDPVFQPLKIARTGITEAVRGNVLVFAHKEAHLDDLARLFPAERYVAVDDKAEVLARIKMHWGPRVRTVHVLQGKYADDPYDGPRPDVVLTGIAELAVGRGRAAGASLFDDVMSAARQRERPGG